MTKKVDFLRSAAITASAVLILSSCETDGDRHSLNATPLEIEFAAGGGSKTIQIEANAEWRVVSDETWCVVSPASGTGNGTVTVNIEENTDKVHRIALLSVSDIQYGQSKYITVTQTGREQSSETQYDIYVAGRNKDGYATYWKNGVAYVNQNVQGTYNSIAIEKGDVYTTYHIGTYPTVSAYYCKNNGSPVTLAGTGNKEVYYIAVLNGNVYVAGRRGTLGNTRAEYWLNGELKSLDVTNLQRESQAKSVFISNGNVYFAGYEIVPFSEYPVTNGNYSSAVYWKNGARVKLAGSSQTNAEADAIFVSDNDDIYVTGTQITSGGCNLNYWKNGTSFPLAQSLRPNSFMYGAIAVSSNGDVHVIDYITTAVTPSLEIESKYWKNGVEVALGVYLIRIAVTGNDVYILSGGFGESKYWKNGTIVDFTSESGAFARNIVVAIDGTSGGSGNGGGTPGGGGNNGGGGGDNPGGNPAVCSSIQNNYNNTKRQRDEAQRKYQEALATGSIWASSYAMMVSQYNDILFRYQQMARDNGCTLNL